MGFLLKTLTAQKDAVVITIAAPDLIQELWEGGTWVHPSVFLKAAQAALACLAIQALGEEDTKEVVELQWLWSNSPFKSLTTSSLKQGGVRVNYSWSKDATEKDNFQKLKGTFHLRKILGNNESSGTVDSNGDISTDIQEITLRSLQRDCGFGISVRWTIDDSKKRPLLQITKAHAYLVDILPPSSGKTYEEVCTGWNRYLETLGTPAEWELPTEPKASAVEMMNLLTANAGGKELFSTYVSFYCNCTITKVKNILNILPDEDKRALEEIVEITCKHCGKIYRVDKPKFD